MKKIIALFLFTVLIFSLGACSKKEPVSDKELNFNTIDINGEELDKSLFEQNELTAICFWRTNMPQCTDVFLPIVEQLYEQYSSKGFTVVSCAVDTVDDSRGTMRNESIILASREYIKEAKGKFITIIPDEFIMETLVNAKIMYYPSIVFVDQDGKQVGEIIFGKPDFESWAAELDSARQEKK